MDAIQHRLRHWMVGDVLPFWSTAGRDPASGLFHEQMLMDGTPDRTAPLRLRVQFRQIYALSHASVRGWFDEGAAVALASLEPVMSAFRGPDGRPGLLERLAPDRAPLSIRRDSYDHAFVVLGLAWLARATGDRAVHALIDEMLAFVDEEMTDAEGHLLEGVPHGLPRRQNPQMHWFEAMLALHEAIGHPQALSRASRMRQLFEARLLDQTSGLLGEYFDDDWRPAQGTAGAVVEPGHMAEWVWLLRRHEQLALLPKGDLASRLMARVAGFADPVSQLLVDETDRTGAVRRGTRRSWLQTEHCKAWLAQAEAGVHGARSRAVDALVALDRHYLARPFRAGWIDQLDEAGRALPGPVPGSTLYHVLSAVLEADRVLS
jgi:mannose/cellobiose epimerase-like protein (N-acyl-D-glucosamine 2-epimerase family)